MRNPGYIEIKYPSGHTDVVTAQSLVQSIVNRAATPFSMWLPPSVRYIERCFANGGGGVFKRYYVVVTEQEAGMKTVLYKRTKAERQPKAARISTPYIVNIFLIEITRDGYLDLDTTYPVTFYTKEPLSGFGSQLYCANLPNIMYSSWSPGSVFGANGWTCFHGLNVGDLVARIDQNKFEVDAVACLADKILQYQWNSYFILDDEASEAYRVYGEMIPEVATIRQWAKESLKNPNLGLELPWVPHPEGASLGDVIDSIQESYGEIQPIKFAPYGREYTIGDGTEQRLGLALREAISEGYKVF
jgi:hypothetical protein